MTAIAKGNHEVLTVIGEVVLAIILFTDASGIALSRLQQIGSLPARLLGIGLPLTMLLGLVAAIPLFPDIPLAWLAIMACILAPTDAAFGIASWLSESQHHGSWFSLEQILNVAVAAPLVQSNGLLHSIAP